MFKWIGKRVAAGAMDRAKQDVVGVSVKLLEVLKAPPEHALMLWNSLSPEDKELFRKAAISAARLTAKMIIAADSGGKVDF